VQQIGRLDAFQNWCREQRTTMQGQVEALQSGRLRLHSYHGGQMENRSAETLADLLQRIAEIDKLLGRG
jgi:hypothetical protein